ncbi:hypothetical protein [Pimelobacter simplex]|uniref:hypothetical protein n=1 Tax=Nocardioides simplex TaxID=2045 RepID=UPI0021502AE7|nr:hypothetical protein [Pimelobacter simplex]UUW89077.1 hypothetical protein M0M43_25570 [Pimelobacter simplex]UUW98581.1 hypothetical protein M0M48_14220 [Pimelobacter simplex]
MTDNEKSPTPEAPEPAAPAAATEPTAAAEATPPTEAAPLGPPPAGPPPVLKQRWRDRAFTLRSLLAVGVAGVVLGAGAGAGTALVAGHDDGPDRSGRPEWMQGPGSGRFPGGGGGGGGMGDGNGLRFAPPGSSQVPPGTVPEQQGQSDGSGSSGSSSSSDSSGGAANG